MGFWEAIRSYITGDILVQLLQWWGVLFGIGLLFLPICARLFHRFFDKGYAFSKVLGTVAAVYATWLAISLGMATFSQGTCMVAVVFVALAGALAMRHGEYRKTVRDNLKIMLFEEALFLGALIFWGFIRTLHPEIHGVEKFMDYGFMTAILNSGHLPPPDPWFSGFTINYYYFGHFSYAWLTKLSAIHPPVAYNLSIATLFAFSFSLVYSLAANMVYLRKDCAKALHHAAGLVSALLFTLGGNLFTATYGFLLPLCKVLGIYHGRLSSNYANATRFVGYFPPTADKLITEFPSYSFVVADLHAHVMSIPLVLTILGLSLAHMQSAFDKRDGAGIGKGFPRHITLFLWMALVLAAASMTNAWTLPTGAFTICAVMGMARYLETGKPMQGALAFIIAGVVLTLSTAILTLPFQAHFKNFSQGYRLSDAHTPLWQMLILWGYQFFIGAWFMAALLIKRRNSPLRLTAPDFIAITFLLCALVFIAIPECVYVKDIYGYDFRRANTVFKFSYEAFILVTAPVGYFAVVTGAKLTDPSRRATVVALLVMVLYLPMTFTWVAFMQGCKIPEKPGQWGLDGLAYMASANPGDYGAAAWLRENAPDDAIILEAEGDSYTDYGRISMMSGRQTVLGWFVHEWLWRNDKEGVEKRRSDVKGIYEAKNSSEAVTLLRKYKVRYLVIGALEAKRYPGISRSVLMGLGKEVFRSDGTVIIEVIPGEPSGLGAAKSNHSYRFNTFRKEFLVCRDRSG
jgi:uncharacterized membrane protein